MPLLILNEGVFRNLPAPTLGAVDFKPAPILHLFNLTLLEMSRQRWAMMWRWGFLTCFGGVLLHSQRLLEASLSGTPRSVPRYGLGGTEELIFLCMCCQEAEAAGETLGRSLPAEKYRVANLAHTSRSGRQRLRLAPGLRSLPKRFPRVAGSPALLCAFNRLPILWTPPVNGSAAASDTL